MGRSFYLQDQRPADTCSGTEKIINKDPAFVSSWAPSNLFDPDEEEEEIVNVTVWRFSVKSLHSRGTAVRKVRNLSILKIPWPLSTVPIRHFFAEASVNIFGVQSYVFLKWLLEEMTLWYGWSCIECLRWWMMILYCIRLHSSWIGIVGLQEGY